MTPTATMPDAQHKLKALRTLATLSVVALGISSQITL